MLRGIDHSIVFGIIFTILWKRFLLIFSIFREKNPLECYLKRSKEFFNSTGDERREFSNFL